MSTITGEVRELPSGPQRYSVAQALLAVFLFDEEVRQWLVKHPDTATVISSKRCEAFPIIRISTAILSENDRSSFRLVIAEALVKNPPYELDWLDNLPSMIDYMCKPEAFAISMKLPAAQMEQLLAIRGYLAGDMLSHCLSKRNRVDYGINEHGIKRISVPFRGADTPSLRSEFSHPDCTICWTILSYYSDGLIEEQLRQALETLLSLAPVTQTSFYDDWLSISAGRMSS